MKVQKSLPVKSVKKTVFLFSFLLSLLLWPVLPAHTLKAQAEEAPPAALPGDIRISEVMIKNRSTFCDSEGMFPDWIELHNVSGHDIVLEGWSLSDSEKKTGLVFPAFLFPDDSYCLVYAAGIDAPESLQAPFSLSGGETVYLRGPGGSLIDSLLCPDLSADRSFTLKEDGTYHVCLYPTPGLENTTAAYDSWQESLPLPQTLMLNEVLVSDPNGRFSPYDGSDWVELKNNGSTPISLSEWSLSDDPDDLLLAPLPAATLEPGEITTVRCDQLGLSLNSENEQIYLSYKGNLIDFLTLRDIPYGGSYGRMSGHGGAYFFETASPDEANRNGRRRVSATPTAIGEDGIFSGEEPVLLDMEAEGIIYYTYDSTIPTTSSLRWAGLTQIPASCVIRAVAVEENALPSRPLTLSYFIGENHSLPIVSLVTDNKTAFWGMYETSWKGLEWPGNIAFYEDSGSFSIPCGISLHGDTSLVHVKKGMSLNFRGVYGQETLDYDLFGGGVTSFGNLVLRGGQDQTRSIIRNELCEALALNASEHIIGMRSRYCVVYLDGEYFGIYSLTEKMNEQHYANLIGVSKKSTTVVEPPFYIGYPIYEEIFGFCHDHDMRNEKNYNVFLSRMDVDSLIDWVFIEGYFANSDLTYGNLRFCRSTEGDGLWRLMFYDLDAAFSDPAINHSIILHRNPVQCSEVSNLFADLWVNEDFRDRFLSRAAELLKGPLSEANVLAEIDRLAAEVAPEAARDQRLQGRSYAEWEKSVQALRDFIINNNWTRHNINAICHELFISDAERARYFG